MENSSRDPATKLATYSWWTKDTDIEAAHPRKKRLGALGHFLLAYSAVGVIFGDIGTSPLYTYSSTFTKGVPTYDDILGAACIIFWSITLVVIIKYCLIVLCFDDNGEGGTFALYSLICRHSGITPANKGAPDESDLRLSRYSNSGHRTTSSTTKVQLTKMSSGFKAADMLRTILQTSVWARQALLVLVLFMTSMVLGDGILTPAQSVLGAIYGIQVKHPDVTTGTIVGISCGILAALFLVQRFGTAKVGSTFAPIVITWFTFNVVVNVYNIVKYNPSIFKAISPHYGMQYFINNKKEGWVTISGLFLAITGTEATYADLGHFSKASIQMAFCFIAYPSLVITYLGQAAWLTQFPEQVGSTFYASIPWGDKFYWTFFVVATAAACVASQAMITGAFSIIRQSISLDCFPKVTIIHTSKKILGQIYLPIVNWVMMILTIVVVGIFKNTTKLGNAYGLAVSCMMLGTTILVTMSMVLVWEVNPILALLFLVVAGFIDGVFLSANLNKVPKGGWFAIAMAMSVFTISYIYYWGTAKKRQFAADNKIKLRDLVNLRSPQSSMSTKEPTREAAPLLPESPEASPNSSEEATKTVSAECTPSDTSRPTGEEISEAAELSHQAQQNEVIPAVVPVLLDVASGMPVPRIPGLALVYSDTIFGVPPLMANLIARWGLHETVIIITVRRVAIPRVLPEERLLFSKLPQVGFYRVIARYGYMDTVQHGYKFVDSLIARVVADSPELLPKLTYAAEQTKISYVLSRTIMFAKPAPERASLAVRVAASFRKVVLEGVYGIFTRLALAQWEGWSIPHVGLFEVGTIAEV